MISQSAAAVDLNVDAGTFYVDTTNNRVGVGGKTDPDTPLHVIGTVTATLFAGSGASLTSIPNSALTNSSITINSTAVSLGGSLTLTTANIAENTNLYYTNARADARIAAADTDDLSEGSSNLYYTDARVDARVSGGSLGNITTTGYIRGPATFTLDPAAHGDNSGTVVIAGNLQVDGTTTTINSTTMTVDDKNITLASGSANAGAASGAGFTVDIGSGTNPAITYDGTNDEWDFNKPLNVTGSVTADGLEVGAATPVIEIDSTTAANLATLQFTTSGTVDSKITHQASSGDMVIESGRNSTWGGKIYLKTDTVQNAVFTRTTSTFNENGADIDFRVESTGSTSMLFVNAGANQVGVGCTSINPDVTMQVERSGSNAYIRVVETGNTGIDFGQETNGNGIINLRDSASLRTFIGGSERTTLTSAGNLGIGNSAPTSYNGYKILHLGSAAAGGQGLLKFGNGTTADGPELYAPSSGNRLHLNTSGSVNVLNLVNSNVGIGTSAPATSLSFGEASTGITFLSTATNFNSGKVAGIRGEVGGTGYGNLAFDTFQGGSGGGERMMIRYDGNVGIGTNSPAAKLAFGGFGQIWVNNDASNPFGIDTVAGELRLFTGNSAAYQMKFGKMATDGTTFTSHLTIGDDGSNRGNVGIGTDTPAYPLEISGAGTVSLAYQRTGTGVTAKKWGFHSDNSNTYWQNITDNLLAITVSNAGNVGIGTSPVSTLDVRSTNAVGSVFRKDFNGPVADTFSKVAVTLWGQDHDDADAGTGTDQFGPMLGFGARIDDGNPNSGDVRAGISYSYNGDLTFHAKAGASVADGSYERIRIDGVTGNVGIGTGGPGAKLQVSIDDATNYASSEASELAPVGTDALYLFNEENSSTNGKTSILMRSAGGGGGAAARITLKNERSGAGSLRFLLRDSAHTTEQREKMVIESSGNVGIGTDSPGTKLDVLGNVRVQAGNVWSETTQGGSTGSIHIDPNSATDHAGGSITFGASDTSNGTNAHAGIYVRSDGSYGTKMYLSTTDSYGVGSKTAMMIDQAGNVGIGTSSPGARKLKIVGSSSAYPLSLDSTDSDYQLEFTKNGTSEWWIAASASSFKIHENGVGDKLTVLAGGNVGIGTSSPDAKFEVEWTGTNVSTNSIARITAPVYPNLEFYSTNTNSNNRNWKLSSVYNSYGTFEFLKSSAANGVPNQTVMAMDKDGKVGIGTHAPAQKLHIKDTSTSGGIMLTRESSDAGAYLGVKYQHSPSDSSYYSEMLFRQVDTNHGGQIEFWTDNSVGTAVQRMLINKSGQVAIGGAPQESDTLTVTTTTTDGSLRLVNSNTGSGSTRFVIENRSTSPAANDGIGDIQFIGKNSAGNANGAAYISVIAEDVTNGSYDSSMNISTLVAGYIRNRIRFTPTQTVVNEDSVALNFRVESNNNDNMIHVDGTNDRVGIGRVPATHPLEVQGHADFKSSVAVAGSLAAGATVITSADSSNAFIVKTNHSGNPTALQIGGAGAINGVSSANQSFTILNVAKDSGSNKSAYFHGHVKTAGNFVVDAGQGVHFGGTAGASGMTSQVLDDYEEGTWTPKIAHNDGTGEVPLTVSSAKYTKIGNVVYVNGYLTAINPNGNAGTSSPYYGIRNFPFTPMNYGTWNLAYASSNITFYGGYSSTASFYFLLPTGSSPMGQAHVSGTAFNAYGSNLVLMFSAVYIVN